MKTKLCSFMYTPKKAAAVLVKPMRMRFMKKVMAELTLLMTMLGMLMRDISFAARRLGLYLVKES